MRLELTFGIEQSLRDDIKKRCSSLFDFDDDREIILMSQSPPAWIDMIGGLKDWLQPLLILGASAFLTGFCSQLGKRTADRISKLAPSKNRIEENDITNQYKELIDTMRHIQTSLGNSPKVSVGVPIPCDLHLGNISLKLPNKTYDHLSFEMSIFILYIEEIYKLISDEVEKGNKPSLGVYIKINSDNNIDIIWREYPILKDRMLTIDTEIRTESKSH